MSTFNYQDAIRRFQQAQETANAANESRYQGTLGVLNKRSADVQSLYSGTGTAARGRAARANVEGNAADTQSLISRGLYNTGTLDATRRGRAQDLENQNQAIDEQSSTLRGGALERTQGDVAGVMERRTDRGPDQGIYAQLLQQQGAAQAIANPTRSQTTVGGVPGGGGGGGGGRGGGGGAGGVRFGSTGGGAGGGMAHENSGPNYASIGSGVRGPNGNILPDPETLRGGGRVDAVEGSNYGRQNFGGTSGNAATNAMRRMVPTYSNSIGG